MRFKRSLCPLGNAPVPFPAPTPDETRKVIEEETAAIIASIRKAASAAMKRPRKIIVIDE